MERVWGIGEDGGRFGAEAAAFAEAVAIMARLRGPGGCPWDREQSFDSIRKYTLEETYEVLDAIERRDWANLSEELGDLLLQVLFYAEMASELDADAGRFSIVDVLAGLNRKLIRRHPHVFGEAASAAAGNVAVVDVAVEGSAARVLANWDAIKKAEKGEAAGVSLLDGVMRGQPALLEASKLGSKAAKVGFDWPDWRGLLAKVAEETDELVEAVSARAEKQKQIPFGNDNKKSKDEKQIPFGNDSQNGKDEQQIPFGNDSQKDKINDNGKNKSAAEQDEVEAELGDLLFTVVNLGRHLGVDSEMALRGTNARFRARFGWMEREAGRPLAEFAPEELEQLWAGAKRGLVSRAEAVETTELGVAE
jgi:nucleoside triphosphate diphosphatase